MSKNLDTAVDMVVNSIQASRQRFVESLQSANTKQNKCWSDYGYPTSLKFSDFYTMYKRNGYANAGVNVVADKCWQTNPWLETGNANWDREFSKFAKRVNLWQSLKQLDAFQRVGQYAGLVLTIADGKRTSEPVDGNITLDAIEAVTPYYQGQLEPTGDYYDDVTDIKYGLPKAYLLKETGLGDRNDGTTNQRIIHESRVVIWAEGASGNSIFGTSVLEAGFNALINIEKINGAGGEGFWKNARTPLQLSAESGMDLSELAASYGVEVSELSDKVNEKLKAFNTSLDAAFLLGGMKATPMTVSLPNPQEFLQGNKLEFAASVKIPLTILEGNQTGNQSSTENGNTFDEMCESRRANEIDSFIVNRLIGRLVEFKAIAELDAYTVKWDSLIEPSPSERLDAALKMVEANAKALGTGETYFTRQEIRERAGYFDDEV